MKFILSPKNQHISLNSENFSQVLVKLSFCYAGFSAVWVLPTLKGPCLLPQVPGWFRGRIFPATCQRPVFDSWPCRSMYVTVITHLTWAVEPCWSSLPSKGHKLSVLDSSSAIVKGVGHGWGNSVTEFLKNRSLLSNHTHPEVWSRCTPTSFCWISGHSWKPGKLNSKAENTLEVTH